jgi:spermidine/putrescine transport system substrate-binding protein
MVLVMLVLSTAMPVSAEEEAEILNVYNWGVYMDLGQGDGSYHGEDSAMDVNVAFEKWYQDTYGKTIKVNYTTYENNESMYQKLAAGGAQYDIVIPSDYMISRMIKEDMLEKLDFANIPNYKNIDDSFKGDDWKYDPTHEYSVPYMWGYVGIVYNPEYVKGTVNSFDVLWDEAYKGKILMFNNARDTFMIALAKNGFSLNTMVEADWQKAYEDLEAQKPLVQGYVTDEVFDKMQNGEAYLAPCYYGDYLIMTANAAEGVELKFGTMSENISNKYVDAMCIPKGCQNKLAAERYIDFMCSYGAGVANANYTGYSSPLKTVANNTGDLYYHYTGDPGVYPSRTVLSDYEEYLYLGETIQGVMDDHWKNLKKADGGVWLYVSLFAVLAVVIVVLVLRKKKQQKLEEA